MINETDMCSLVALNFYACKMEDLEHTVGDGRFPGWYSQTALYLH